MGAENRLKELGIVLPPAPKALATYRSAVQSGNQLYIAGQGPIQGGTATVTGKVGGDVTIERASEAAREATLNALAVAREHLGSLDRVRQVVRATVYVASVDGFTQQPQVANGATALLQSIWGEKGLPARAAVGVNVLPLDIPVEVELLLEIESKGAGS